MPTHEDRRLIRKLLSHVGGRVREIPFVKTRIERWHRANERADLFLKRVGRHFKKRKFLTPADYSGLVKPDDVLDLGDGTFVTMTAVMDHYARAWHPLMADEDVDFWGPTPEATTRMYEAYARSQAIDLYLKHHQEGHLPRCGL